MVGKRMVGTRELEDISSSEMWNEITKNDDEMT